MAVTNKRLLSWFKYIEKKYVKRQESYFFNILSIIYKIAIYFNSNLLEKIDSCSAIKKYKFCVTSM